MSTTEPPESTGGSAEQPIEQLAVTFFETPCLAVRSRDGTIYMAIRDVCNSVRQRGTIYHLVQTWAQERTTREHLNIGAALRACWSALRTRYKVSRYEDIERQYFDDCVTYIQRQYQKLTGTELHLPEQSELDL